MVHSLRPWLMAALVALPAVSAPSSGFDVRVKEGLVTIDARAAPLSDVLDQLGHQTGMKVVYEAGRPRQIVSAAIEGLPPADALAKLLEGLGVGYGFSLDATGARVETLIISGAAGAAKASLAPSPSHLPLARPVESSGPPRIEAEVDASQAEDEETPEPTNPTDLETALAAPAANVPDSISGRPPSFSPFTGPAMLPPGFPGSASAPFPMMPRPFMPAGASNPRPPQ